MKKIERKHATAALNRSLHSMTLIISCGLCLLSEPWKPSPDLYLSLYDCNRVKLLSSPVEHFFPTQFLPSFPSSSSSCQVTWPVLTPAGPIKQQPLSSGSDTRGANAYSASGSSAKFLRRSSTTAAAHQPPLGLIRSAESISNGRAAERLPRKRGSVMLGGIRTDLLATVTLLCLSQTATRCRWVPSTFNLCWHLPD